MTSRLWTTGQGLETPPHKQQPRAGLREGLSLAQGARQEGSSVAHNDGSLRREEAAGRVRRGAASGAVTVRTPACRRGSSRADPHHWGAAPLEVKTPMPLQRVAVGGMRRCLCSVPQGLGPEMAGTRLGPGSRKKIRDPGTSITAEKFKVFRTGLESKGATEYSLKNAVENSHQNLMTQPIVQLDLPLLVGSGVLQEPVKSCRQESKCHAPGLVGREILAILSGFSIPK